MDTWTLQVLTQHATELIDAKPSDTIRHSKLVKWQKSSKQISYQVLGTRISVERAWYKDPHVATSWYQDLGINLLVYKDPPLPSYWYQDLDIKILLLQSPVTKISAPMFLYRLGDNLSYPSGPKGPITEDMSKNLRQNPETVFPQCTH